MPTNTLTFNADNAKSYMVGVRAGNDHGWSGWRNSPQAGPYTPPPPTPTPTPQPEPTATPTPQPEPTATPTPQPEPTPTPEPEPTPTATPQPEPTATPTPEPEPTATPPPEPEPTATPTPQPQAPAAPTGLSATGSDRAVTLAWNNPADASVTGYQVQANHTDTGTGKLSGWSAWWDVPNSGAVATSYTLSNLTNGKEYRFKLRAVNAAGKSKPGPQSAPWYVVAWPQKPPPPAAPSNVAVNPGAGYLDISWNAVSDATGYDVKAKTSGSSTWHDVVSNISATSYRYTTSQTIDYVAVRARNSGGTSGWAELSHAPAHNWLTTVIQGGASGQSAQSQNQLAAPASITVTRDNNLADEKLHATWAAVSGADGYNLACAASPDNAPLSSWSWWHCGSVDSGSTTTFTVDDDKRHGITRDLGWSRSYAVAVRAVTASPAQAGPWLVSEDAHPAEDPEHITASRADGSVSLSWSPPHHLSTHIQGYEIECATRTGNVTTTYTRCADVDSATPVNGRLNVTISSWTASGTDYTIDDSKTYDLQVRTTNPWGESVWRFAPLIYPVVKLSASDIGVTTATLTIANHSDAWYYKANAAPHTTCQDKVDAGTSTKNLSRLNVHTAYDYTAYSDSACTTGNELASAQFTTLSSVSSLGSTGTTGDADIHSSQHQAVAFSISSTASSSKYILKTVTLPMRNKGGTRDLDVGLHEMDGSGPYSTSSQPKTDAVANVTFSGTTPTSSSFANTTWTCSGSGCELARDKTYFVVFGSSDLNPAYAATYALVESETALPSNNGWSIGYGHYNSGQGTSWRTFATPDYNIAEFVFAHAPSLTSSGITGTRATLTLNHYNDGNWYYQADKAPHTTCQGPVTSASTTLSGLTSSATYTYTAYSDSACTTGNKLAEAAAFTTTTTGSVSNLTSVKHNGSGKINWSINQAAAFTTGSNSNGYVLESVTIPLKYEGGTLGHVGLALHTMDGGGTYSTSSKPSRENLKNATFSGSPPTSTSWTDTTWTCSGSDCTLAADTTYFVMAESNAEVPGYGWAYTKTQVETKQPSNNGWSIRFGHNNNKNVWNSHGDWSLAEFVFTTVP